MKLTAKIKGLLKTIVPSQIFWIPRYYHLYKRINFENGALMLDAGCGEGVVTEYLAKKKFKIIGIDKSFEKVKEAFRNCRKNIFLVADINDLPFKENTFDVVFSLDVLEYVNDTKRVFKEFSHTLKPRGKLIISLPREYICFPKFALQHILRTITPPFLYTHDLFIDKGWLNVSDRKTAEVKYGKILSLSKLEHIYKDWFDIYRYECYHKILTALAYDIVYGIRGFSFLRYLLFFIAVRIDGCFFKKMSGYSLFIELIKKDGNS